MCNSVDDQITVLQKLDEGAQGQLYLASYRVAYNDKRYQLLALKVSKGGKGECLAHEYDVLSKLSHDKIVAVIDGFAYDSQTTLELSTGSLPRTIRVGLNQDRQLSQTCAEAFIIAQEYALFGDLFGYIRDSIVGFPEQIARKLFTELVQALEYLHAQGIAHRDLKAENLLLDENFSLKIADFGFAKRYKSNQIYEREDPQFYEMLLQSNLGTPGYTPPELFEKQPYQGEAVDVFSAGVILYVLLTGNIPFREGHPRLCEIYRSFCERNDLYWRSREHSVKRKFSAELKTLLNGMLACNAAQRFTLQQVRQSAWFKQEVAPTKPYFVKNHTSLLQRKLDILVNAKRLLRQEMLIGTNKSTYCAQPKDSVETLPRNFAEQLCNNSTTTLCDDLLSLGENRFLQERDTCASTVTKKQAQLFQQQSYSQEINHAQYDVIKTQNLQLRQQKPLSSFMKFRLNFLENDVKLNPNESNSQRNARCQEAWHAQYNNESNKQAFEALAIQHELQQQQENNQSQNQNSQAKKHIARPNNFHGTQQQTSSARKREDKRKTSKRREITNNQVNQTEILNKDQNY